MNDYSQMLINITHLAREYQQAILKHQTIKAVEVADHLVMEVGRLYDWTESKKLEEEKRA